MDKAPRTRVYLTVDVECAEERVANGGFSPALGYDLRVWGRFRDQPDDLGVPLILKQLAQHGQKATFFVEALGSRHFGEAGLSELCARLRDDGQDVQLHTHPIQRRADWHTRGEPAGADNVAAYPLAEQEALLADGLERLARAGIDPAGLLGFRAGNYGASNDTWRAMRAVGLRVSSNLNLSYRRKSCYIRWPSDANALFETDVQGIWELPISNFHDGRGRLRHVQITAVSFAEMRHYLIEARRLGLPEVTIVTHSFEFYFIDSAAECSGHPNAINIRRLRKLLEFLHDRSEDFELDTVGALARRLTNGAAAPAATGGLATAIPQGRPTLRMGRYVEQAFKRLSARRLPFA